MAFWTPWVAAVTRHRLDAAIVGVLLAGSLGFGDSTIWLQSAPTIAGPGKAFVVIAPRHAGPLAGTPLPRLAYSAAPLGPAGGGLGGGFGGGFKVTSMAPAPDGGDLVANNRPGGSLATGPAAAPRIASALPNSLNFGSGPGSLTAGFSARRSAPAVPEPSTWALIVLGMAIVGGFARRRRNRALPA